MKQKKIEKKQNNNILTKDDLNNLDSFIQKCLDNFKFVEPKRELYEATGNDKNIIISHKSTIPDLVIWNKTFNKNNCFIGANTLNQNEFPRFLFYIKIKKNKKPKINNKNNNNNNMKHNNIKNNKKDKNDFDFDFFDKKDLNQNINPNIINKTINNINEKEKEKEQINKINVINQNNKYNNNSSENHKNNKKNEIKNKFSISQNINYNIVNNDNINLAIYFIQLYLDKNGWIILTKDEHFSGPGTSLDLFQYLQEKIKEKTNLNEFIIIDINKQVKYFADYFYMILSNILPKIIQKKQVDFIKYEEIMKKKVLNQFSIINNNQHNILHMNASNYPNIFFLNNINNISNNNNYNNNNNLQLNGVNFIDNKCIVSNELNRFSGINKNNNFNNQYLYMNNNNLNINDNINNNIKMENYK